MKRNWTSRLGRVSPGRIFGSRRVDYFFDDCGGDSDARRLRNDLDAVRSRWA